MTMFVIRSLLEVLFSLVVAVVNHFSNAAMLIAHRFWTIFPGSQWLEYFVEGRLDVAFQFLMRMKARKKGLRIAAYMYIALYICWCLILLHIPSIRCIFFPMDYQKWLCYCWDWVVLLLDSISVNKPGYHMHVFWSFYFMVMLCSRFNTEP